MPINRGSGYSARNPPPGLLNELIGYWRLEEVSGTRFDAHGSRHLTDNNTVAQAAGKIGNAALFVVANSESLSVVSDAGLVTAGSSFTIATWVYLGDMTSQRSIAGKHNGASVAGSEWLLSYSSASNRFLFEIYAGSAGSVTANTFGAPTTATWYYIVAWHDCGADTINIQVNNGAPDTTAWANGSNTTTRAFAIGATSSPSIFYDGRIDEVGFWKRVLTTEERTWLYGAGNGRNYPFV